MAAKDTDPDGDAILLTGAEAAGIGALPVGAEGARLDPAGLCGPLDTGETAQVTVRSDIGDTTGISLRLARTTGRMRSRAARH